MRVLTSLVTIALCLTSPAMADFNVGNFRVSIEKDPFGDADKYIAITVQKGSTLAVRCLNGELNLSFFVSSRAREGEEAEVKLRLDEGRIETFDGGVVGSNLYGAAIQAGDGRFIAKMATAKQLAMKYSIKGVGSTYTFDLRGIDKVVAGARKACRYDG